MKKRILALALAGTTAFSVFGAAMSANAAWIWSDEKYDSTHEQYNIDRYESYVPAGDMDWSSSSATTQYDYSGIKYSVSENARTATSETGVTYWPTSTVLYIDDSVNTADFKGVTGTNGYTLTKISSLSTYGDVTTLMDKAGYTKIDATDGVYTAPNGEVYHIAAISGSAESSDAQFNCIMRRLGRLRLVMTCTTVSRMCMFPRTMWIPMAI